MHRRFREKNRLVLGIDPGLASAGLAVVKHERGRYQALFFECVKTQPSLAFPERLAAINRATKRIISRFRPTEMAMERLFFARNAKTALAVGQAQGAMLLAAAGLELPVYQYTPLQVKMAVTGNGSAGKEVVGKMVQRLFSLDQIPRPDDAADALAVGYCHLVSTRMRPADD